MMRMLVAGGIPALVDESRPADADNPLGYFELEAVKRTREDPSWLERAPGHAVKLVHTLVRDLPENKPYVVVLMRRDLDEVVTSQRKMLERAGRSGAALTPDALKRVFAAQLAETERWLSSRPSIRWIDVHYARVLADPERESQRIAAFLGLSTGSAMAKAVDPSLYRNRRAAGDRKDLPQRHRGTETGGA